jgi:hypothetical protein
MKPVTAINNTRYRAVQLTPGDAEAVAIVEGWVQGQMGKKVPMDLEEAARLRVWAIRHPSGMTNIMHSADFARDFDTVLTDELELGEPFAGFEAQLKEGSEEPQALAEAPDKLLVQPTPEETYNVVVEYYATRIFDFMAWLEDGGDDTEGDEGAYSDGIESAKEKFAEIFKVTSP